MLPPVPRLCRCLSPRRGSWARYRPRSNHTSPFWPASTHAIPRRLRVRDCPQSSSPRRRPCGSTGRRFRRLCRSRPFWSPLFSASLCRPRTGNTRRRFPAGARHRPLPAPKTIRKSAGQSLYAGSPCATSPFAPPRCGRTNRLVWRSRHSGISCRPSPAPHCLRRTKHCLRRECPATSRDSRRPLRNAATGKRGYCPRLNLQPPP